MQYKNHYQNCLKTGQLILLSNPNSLTYKTSMLDLIRVLLFVCFVSKVPIKISCGFSIISCGHLATLSFIGMAKSRNCLGRFTFSTSRVSGNEIRSIKNDFLSKEIKIILKIPNFLMRSQVSFEILKQKGASLEHQTE